MLYIIANPVSGHGRGSKVAEVAQKKLTEAKVDFQLFFTQGSAHATMLARECSEKEDCEGVLVIGGDGTMNEAMIGFNVKRGVPFGILPGGTGNDFCRTLYEGKDVDAILDTVIAGKTKKIDYLEVSGRRCLNVASVGFDVTVLEHYNRYSKHIHGSFVYDLAVFRTLIGLKFHKAHVILDDGAEELDCRYTLVAVGNGRFYGGGMPVTPHAVPDDGKGDLCLINRVPGLKIFGVLMKFMKGTHCDDPYTVYKNCTHVRVIPEKRVTINVDGQLFHSDEFDCRLIPAGLTVFGE